MEETKLCRRVFSDGCKKEKVRRVAVEMIDDFPEHPFKVKDDEEMEKLKDSISLYGVRLLLWQGAVKTGAMN